MPEDQFLLWLHEQGDEKRVLLAKQTIYNSDYCWRIKLANTHKKITLTAFLSRDQSKDNFYTFWGHLGVTERFFQTCYHLIGMKFPRDLENEVFIHAHTQISPSNMFHLCMCGYHISTHLSRCVKASCACWKWWLHGLMETFEGPYQWGLSSLAAVQASAHCQLSSERLGPWDAAKQLKAPQVLRLDGNVEQWA